MNPKGVARRGLNAMSALNATFGHLYEKGVFYRFSRLLGIFAFIAFITFRHHPTSSSNP